MKSLFLFTLLFIAQAAFAANSFQFAKGTVKVGDSSADVTKIAGEPKSKDVNENAKGGPSERWYYQVGNSTVTLLIQGEKVKAISIPKA